MFIFRYQQISIMTSSRTKYIILFSISLIFSFEDAQSQISFKKGDDFFKVQPVITLQSIQEVKNNIPKTTIENEISKAIQLAESGNYRESIYFFNQLIPQLHNPYLVEFYLGIIYLENGQFPLSIKYLQKSLTNNQLFVECRFYIGLAYLNMGHYDKSNQYFESLSNLEGFAHLEYCGKGFIALREGNIKEAEKLFKQSLKINSAFLPSIDALARINLTIGKREIAQEWIQTGLEVNPEWISGPLYLITNDLYNKSTSSDNLEIVNKILSKYPENSQYHFLKAYHYLLQENYRKAVGSFIPAFHYLNRSGNNGIESEISNRIKIVNLILLYYKNHISSDPKLVELMDETICSFIMGDEKTNDLLKNLQSLDSGNSSLTMMIIGVIYKNIDQGSAAIDILGEAILKDSSNWAAHLIRAELFNKYGYSDYADQDCAMAQSKAPKIKENYTVQSRIQYQNLDYKSAYLSLSKALAIDNQDINIFSSRGSIGMKLQAYKEAIVDFTQITNLDLFNSDAYFNLYECYSHLGDTLSTLLYLDTASMYSVNDDLAHYELIKLGEILNFPEEVQIGYNRLVDYHPFRIENVFYRGKYYFTKGEFQNAEIDFKRALYLSKNSENKEYIGELNIWLKKSQEAMKGEG